MSRNYVSMLENGRNPSEQLKMLFERLEGDESPEPATGGPRGKLQAALRSAGMTSAQLARRIGYEAGPVQAIVEGGARISEKMAEAIASVLPLTIEELLGGSDSPRLIDPTGTYGTIGSRPLVDDPSGLVGIRTIPLLSWAEAGTMADYSDEAFGGEAIPAFNVSDRKAFALAIRGKSMQPEISEGDIVVVCPSWTPRHGDTVIARTVGGDVMCKIYQPSKGGQMIILSSHNPAFPPFEIPQSEIAWIYPVKSVEKTLRRS